MMARPGSLTNGLIAVDGTAYGRRLPAWVVTVTRLTDTVGEGIAFVGASSADEARIRAFELFAQEPACRFGCLLDRATTKVEQAPDNALYG